MAGQSSSNATPELWKKLWGLSIHPKVKLFVWKCFNCVVATKRALFERKLAPDPMCNICGKAVESIVHLLFQCEHAVKVWIHSPFRFRPEETIECIHMTDVWAMLHNRVSSQHLPSNTLGLGLIYCWWIWRARNDLIFNAKSWSCEEVSRKAQSEFVAFVEANGRAAVASSPTDRSVAVWTRPEGTSIKINVDAALAKGPHRAGVGAVARGSDGKVLGILLACYMGISSSRIAEAMAIRDGLRLGIALQAAEVYVESDAQAIVRNCNSPADPPTDVAVPIQDAIALKRSFISCEFQFVNRECNRAAHNCAKKALLNDLSGLWTSVLPPWGSELSDL